MYFKKGELIKYPDERTFIVKESKEEWASLGMLVQLEDTNEYFRTGISITVSNKESDYTGEEDFEKNKVIILYNSLAEHKSLDEMLASINENKPIKFAPPWWIKANKMK